MESLTCSACGISVEDDIYPVYVTYYPPRQAAQRGAMALCEVHHLEVVKRMKMNALELPDRYLEPPDAVFSDPVVAHDVYESLGRVDPGPRQPSRARMDKIHAERSTEE